MVAQIPGNVRAIFVGRPGEGERMNVPMRAAYSIDVLIWHAWQTSRVKQLEKRERSVNNS